MPIAVVDDDALKLAIVEESNPTEIELFALVRSSLMVAEILKCPFHLL